MVYSAFNDVLELIEKLNSRPFLKRYLKREEIQQEIVQCDALLTDALSLFSVSTVRCCTKAHD